MAATSPHRGSTNPTVADSRVERWLKEQLVNYRFETVPLDTINTRASRANQARIKPIDDETAERYARDMEAGAIFPALVAVERANRLIVIDGNHRHEAMLRVPWADETDVYVVDANDETVLRLTYLANYQNGLPNTPEERLLHAMHLVEAGAVRNAREAATLLGLPRAGAITEAIHLRKTRERAAQMGIRGHGLIKQSVLARIGVVRSDPAFEALLRLVIARDIPPGDVQKMVAEINDARSDAQKLAIVQAAEDLFRALAAAPETGAAGGRVGKKGRQMADWARFKGALTNVLAFTEDDIKASVPSNDVLEGVLNLVGRARDHLASFGGDGA